MTDGIPLPTGGINIPAQQQVLKAYTINVPNNVLHIKGVEIAIASGGVLVIYGPEGIIDAFAPNQWWHIHKD